MPMMKGTTMPKVPEDLQFRNAIDAIRIVVQSVEAGENVPPEVVQHLTNNLVLVTGKTSICVDGGYKPNEAMGELARAGGDLGISMALLKMGLTPNDAFSVVFQYRKNKGQKYGWHSDTHVDPKQDQAGEHHEHSKGAIVGCGHCNAAYQYAQKYGIPQESVIELLSIIKKYQVSHKADMSYVVLDRDHAEEGIFVVKSTEVTVLPWDMKTEKQFFVYDAARDELLLKDIAQQALPKLLEKRPELMVEAAFEELKQVVKEQTDTTLSLLGTSKGKPMYEINYNNGVVTVTFAGNAPSA